MSGTAVEYVFNVVTTDPGEIVELQVPGRAEVIKVAVASLTGVGSFSINLFNRAFTLPAVTVTKIVQSTVFSGKLQLQTATELLVRVGDDITIAGAATGGYNTTARVLAISADFRTVDVDITHSADEGSGATIALNLSATQQALYRVIPQQTDTGAIVFFAAEGAGGKYVLVNRDVVGLLNNFGIPRKAYLQLSEGGTYQVAVTLLALGVDS